jgi:hypothetical protein
MSAARYDLVIDQGSDFGLEFTIKESGTIKPLVGYSARAHLRKSKSSSTLSAAFTCGLSNPSQGTVQMSLPNSVSSALSPGIYHYDLEIYTASDVIVTRLIEGTATLTQGVTR